MKKLFVILCYSVIVIIYLSKYNRSYWKNEFHNLNKQEQRKSLILLFLVLLLGLTFIIVGLSNSNDDINLGTYQNCYIGDNSSVGGIINNIHSGKYVDTFELDTEIPYGVIINYKTDIYGDIYKNIEEDALILFNLIQNIDYVQFNINDKVYKFDSNYIENIYQNIKEVEIDDIVLRYQTEYFMNYTYLGHINKYDVFDTSSFCGTDKNLIYSDTEYDYYVMCSNIDNLYLVGGEINMELKKALEQNIVNIDELFNINLKITKENK